jgi:excisionase family DNA binding protein
MKKYYVKEAAQAIGVSTSLMYLLLEKRRIRHERHGIGRGRYVITEEALEEYRKAREVGVAIGDEPVAELPATRLEYLSLE